MKKQINEIKRMQLIAGLITESEYQESLMKEAIKVIQDGDQIEISDDSGNYSGFIEDDGTVRFSVVYEGEDFNDENWRDILGSNHAFVKIIDKIGGDVEALDDYVQITVDANKLINI